MRSKPKISVLMSVYNGEEFISGSINSILNQTFTNFEFIIVNDGSTDQTKEILESFSDDRIRIINHKNRGLTISLNLGIKKSKSDLIARIDADDLAHLNRLLKKCNFLIQNHKVGLLGTRAKIINREMIKSSKKFERDEILSYLNKGNPFIH